MKYLLYVMYFQVGLGYCASIWLEMKKEGYAFPVRFMASLVIGTFWPVYWGAKESTQKAD